MSVNREDVVFIGKGKDKDNFEVDVLKDTVTGAIYHGYSIEQWEARSRYLAQLAKLEEQDNGRTTARAD